MVIVSGVLFNLWIHISLLSVVHNREYSTCDFQYLYPIQSTNGENGRSSSLLSIKEESSGCII